MKSDAELLVEAVRLLRDAQEDNHFLYLGTVNGEINDWLAAYDARQAER